MVNPKEISDVAVRTHAISVRSCARRVRSTASFVVVGKSWSGDAAIDAPLSPATMLRRPSLYRSPSRR